MGISCKFWMQWILGFVNLGCYCCWCQCTSKAHRLLEQQDSKKTWGERTITYQSWQILWDHQIGCRQIPYMLPQIKSTKTRTSSAMICFWELLQWEKLKKQPSEAHYIVNIISWSISSVCAKSNFHPKMLPLHATKQKIFCTLPQFCRRRPAKIVMRCENLLEWKTGIYVMYCNVPWQPKM